MVDFKARTGQPCLRLLGPLGTDIFLRAGRTGCEKVKRQLPNEARFKSCMFKQPFCRCLSIHKSTFMVGRNGPRYLKNGRFTRIESSILLPGEKLGKIGRCVLCLAPALKGAYNTRARACVVRAGRGGAYSGEEDRPARRHDKWPVAQGHPPLPQKQFQSGIGRSRGAPYVQPVAS